jgi:hypothetical protein
VKHDVMEQQMVAEGNENLEDLVVLFYGSVGHYEDAMEDWKIVQDKEMKNEGAMEDWSVFGNADEEEALLMLLREHEV